jgi:hypothetical protein
LKKRKNENNNLRSSTIDIVKKIDFSSEKTYLNQSLDQYEINKGKIYDDDEDEVSRPI